MLKKVLKKVLKKALKLQQKLLLNNFYLYGYEEIPHCRPR
jgi:hypothetical protein